MEDEGRNMVNIEPTSMPFLIILPGGIMLTTSAAPGYPFGPAPRMMRIVFSVIESSVSILWW